MAQLPLPLIFIARTLLDETARLLASFTLRKDSEGVVYWFGLELGQRAVVTTLVVPDAETEMGFVRTSAVANAEAISVMVDTPLVSLGQAHSHPRRWVDHSPLDDRETFAQFPGAISLVVPFYGRRGCELAHCGVHRHLDGRYKRIAQARVSDHLRVIPGFADFRGQHNGV